MPYALSVVGIILSLLILIMPTVDENGKKSLPDATRGMDWEKAVFLVITMVVYGLTMKLFGFIIASIAFLMVGFYILGERRIKAMLLAAIPLVVVLWFVMSSLLGVYIAPGEIFYMLGVL